MFATEFQRGYRDYLKSVLDYDRSFDGFIFSSEVSANLTGSSAPTSEGPVTPLIEMAKRYIEEGELGRQWGPKTIGERREQFMLLSEILGEDISVTSVTPAMARGVKEIIMHTLRTATRAHAPEDSTSRPHWRWKASIQSVCGP
jgi:hypothetical protein